jgi:hypothetical protein
MVSPAIFTPTGGATIGQVAVVTRILLPPGYDENPDARYPVLYLLHGGGTDYRQWSQATSTSIKAIDVLFSAVGVFSGGTDPVDVALAGAYDRPGWHRVTP